MKKLSALLIVLVGICLLPSCAMQDAEDIEPVTVEISLEDTSSETEGEEDPTGSNGG